MKLYIDYNTETGEILGRLTEDNKNLKRGALKEVIRTQWNESKRFNKITINDTNISFEKVDFRTQDAINQENWTELQKYCELLQVTITNDNKYAMNEKSRNAILLEIQTMNDTDSLYWLEDWGVQNSTKADFQEALNEFKKLKDEKFTEIFGV
jgi:hypothetical protein